MHLKISFALLLLGLVAIHALPTEKTEKSLKKEDITIEEASEDKDRSKKSILCLESGGLVPQTYNIQAGQQPVQTLNIQAASQPVQTFSIQSAAQPVQTLSIQPAAQPVQTLSIQPVQTLSIQPVQQPVQTLNLIQPPPAVQSSATLISQQSQPCNTVDVFQPQQPNSVQTSAKVVDKVSEVETITHTEKLVKPKPEKVVYSKVEKEKVITPMMPIYKEEMVVVPQKPLMVLAETEPMTTYFKMPQCQHCQQSVMQCNCRPQGVAAMKSSMVAGPHMHLIGVRGGALGAPVMESVQSRIIESM